MYARSSSDAQLLLPLDHAPEAVRQHGLQEAHRNPLVSMGKREGRPYVSFRTEPSKAWSFVEVEYGRTGSSYVALVIDCDRPSYWRKGLADLPPPNWIVRRKSNDHAHIVYCLEKPVHRYPAARLRPLQFLAHIEGYYIQALGGDPGFNGVLAHNPAPRYRQNKFAKEWGSTQPYSLDALANVIPFNWQPPPKPAGAIGRNCSLFEAGMAWAGKRANADIAVMTALVVTNQGFPKPLPESEVAATARSIEKYREIWKARGWHTPRWIAKQAALGKASGKVRREAVAERNASIRAARLAGMTVKAIAAKHQVSIRTVSYVMAEPWPTVCNEPTQIEGENFP